MRHDFKVIANLIKPNARIIDIGCEGGDLIKYLTKKKQVDGRGIEISQADVRRAVSRGLAVIQGDAESDLKFYSDKSFDYAVLSQTIQATKNPKEILAEMLRIADRAIVSFPNFGHIMNRLQLLFKGRMPVNKNLSYQWYETPNIHFCTIRDFVALTEEMGLEIEKRYYLNKGSSRSRLNNAFKSLGLANLFARQAIFLLKKS